MPAESREDAPGGCCVGYEALVIPRVHLGSCPHQLHLPCYAALCIRAAASLRCPACRSTVAAEEADSRALRQDIEEVTAEATAVARRAMRARKGGGLSARATRDGKGGRVICSACDELVEETTTTTFVHVSCACNVYRRCALGFAEDANPSTKGQQGTHTHTPGHVPESGPTCGAPRGGSTHPSSTDPWTRRIGGHGRGESHIF